MEVTGIILAGGKSSRMGHDKGLLELGGRKLAEIAAGNLSHICSDIIISANDPAYQQFGYRVIPDIHTGIGPIGGLYSALSASKTSLNLVLSVDLPFVNKGLLEYLVSRVEDYQAAVPVSGNNYYEPLCAVYDRSVLSVIEKCIEDQEYKMQRFLDKVYLNKIVISDNLPFFTPHQFLNLNTTDDFSAAAGLTDLG
jgi:molybdopterin-guanine dinucleotide biosynthesis protein A